MERRYGIRDNMAKEFTRYPHRIVCACVFVCVCDVCAL